MSLLRILANKPASSLLLTAEISPPRLYQEMDRIVGIARRLRALGLDAIAVTNSTGGSYKFSPWAIVDDIQRAMSHVPLIIHLTARDEGSARSVYYHLHEMSLKGVRDVLIIRGDPSPGNSKLFDSYRFTTTQLTEMVAGYGAGRLLDGSDSEPLRDLDIFAAAHPEYPERALGKHFDFLKRKIDAGTNALISNIVTDIDAFGRYCDQAYNSGIRVPIFPSLLPLGSVRRCEFLAEELRIPVPAAIIEGLRGKDRDSAHAIGVDNMRHSLERLRRLGVRAANFNVILPADADAVVEVVGQMGTN